MSRLFLVCVVLLLAALQPTARAVEAGEAGEAIFADFDAAALNDSERRLLQTALAVAGDYRGPLDGAWGAASQAALRAYAGREFGAPAQNAHAAALVIGLVEEVTASGWDFRYLPELGISLALPFARLGAPEPEEGGERRWSEDARLSVLTHRFDAEEALRWHGAALKANADPGSLVTERRTDRLVTEGVLRDGRGFYTSSDRVGEHWATVLLVGEPDQAGALNLAAAASGPASPSPGTCPRTAASSGS